MVAPWQHLRTVRFYIQSPYPPAEVEATLREHLTVKNGEPAFRLTPFDRDRYYKGSVTPNGFRLQFPDLFFSPMAEAVGTCVPQSTGTQISLQVSPRWPITVLVPAGMALTFFAFLSLFVVRSGTPQVTATVSSMLFFLVGVLRPLLLIQTEKLRMLKGLEKRFIPQDEKH